MDRRRRSPHRASAETFGLPADFSNRGALSVGARGRRPATASSGTTDAGICA